MPSWKSAQSRIKIKKKTNLAIIVLILIVTLIILGQLVNFTKVLFSPLNTTGVSRKDLWNDKFNINLLMRSNSIAVLSYNPSQKKVTILRLPDETYFDLPRNFGKWQLRSIYDLGGMELLKDALTSFLGIPIDGFLDQKEELVGLIRQNPVKFLSYFPHIKTDLTVWELIRLKLGLSSVRFDKIKVIDLVKLDVLDKGKLADGSEVFTADPVKIDAILTDFVDPKLASEHMSIAVFNATSYSQLAQKAARMITNMGGNVIVTANSNENLSKTLVIGQNSATLERLKQIFSCCGKIDQNLANVESSRAQINIILGEDFYRRFSNK